MKMVFIVYNEALDSGIIEAVRACCDVVEFTKWTKVMGQGRQSEPHLLSHVWPKGNNVLMTCVEDEKAGKIMQYVRDLRRAHGKQGIKAFMMPIDDVT